MNRALLATRLFNVPLLAERSYAEVFVSALADEFHVERLVDTETMETHHRATRYPVLHETQNGIAVVPIVGSLVHRAGPSASASGSQGYAGTQNLLMELDRDPKVNGIILDMDTPGGEVGGIAELGAAIADINTRKPVWALANSLAASAGYWIAASAGKILATPYSRVGSIGVVTMHMDMSKAAEKRGVVVTFVHAGAYKVAGHPFAALDDATRDRMQSMINETYDQFVAHVAQGRGLDEAVIRGTEAAVYSSKEALDLGLVDGISTLGQTIAQMRDHIAERGRAVNIQGSRIMDQNEAAIAAARAEGRTEGATAERTRISAILGHKEAASRPNLARTLAMTSGIEAEAAGAILAAAASETQPEAPPAATPPAAQTDAASTAAALGHLRSSSPQVGTDESAAATAREQRLAEIKANTARTRASA